MPAHCVYDALYRGEAVAELAPKYWVATRRRIPERELELALGPVTVPPPAEQQPSPN